MKTHILQSKNWEKYEKLEGHQTFRLETPDYTTLAILHQTPLGNYLYCPYGPAINPTLAPFYPLSDHESLPTSQKTSADSSAAEKALQDALAALVSLATEKNATFIRIEPTLALNAAKMAKIGKNLGHTIKKSHDLDPAHTWVLDLNADEDTLLANMESRKVRYWRNHAKKGISLRTTQNPDEITVLNDLLQKLGEVDNFTPQDENHLKNQLKSGFATLYIADLAENPIAAALIYDHNDTRYYAHAATDFEHRKLAAGTIILIQMILDAKKNGQKFYDFWGITTSTDHNHPWYGFTMYKKSFGGRQINYSGTYDIILNPTKYRAYHLLRCANRTLRKLKNS